MSIPLYEFPPPDTTGKISHDTGGWTLQSHPGTHPSGREGIVFDVPETTPDGNGCRFILTQKGQDLIDLRGVFYKQLPTGAGIVFDDWTKLKSTSSSVPFGPVQIVGDHFEVNGKRWTWGMTTGFCDYKVFLDGGDLRSLLKQNQDLGARGRRVFLSMVNITSFNPDVYVGKGYYDRFAEYLALNAEYQQYVELDVLPDCQLLGWNLSKCQSHWARVCDAVRGASNVFVSLTNEFDHGGNLEGRPDDYARPGGINVSQGSAVQDATPPCPALGTGAGWGFWEWHAADDPTKFSHEYFIWQGRSTGAVKPCVISEHGRRITEQNADLNYIRSLAYASQANGCGLTIHTEDGKYSRLMGPNQAACVQLAMSILS